MSTPRNQCREVDKEAANRSKTSTLKTAAFRDASPRSMKTLVLANRLCHSNRFGGWYPANLAVNQRPHRLGARVSHLSASEIQMLWRTYSTPLPALAGKELYSGRGPTAHAGTSQRAIIATNPRQRRVPLVSFHVHQHQHRYKLRTLPAALEVVFPSRTHRI